MLDLKNTLFLHLFWRWYYLSHRGYGSCFGFSHGFGCTTPDGYPPPPRAVSFVVSESRFWRFLKQPLISLFLLTDLKKLSVIHKISYHHNIFQYVCVTSSLISLARCTSIGRRCCFSNLRCSSNFHCGGNAVLRTSLISVRDHGHTQWMNHQGQSVY